MTKLCPRGKAAAKRKFRVYPSAYANAYASKICAGKIKDPSGKKRKDFRGPKPAKAMGGRIYKVDGGEISGKDITKTKPRKLERLDARTRYENAIKNKQRRDKMLRKKERMGSSGSFTPIVGEASMFRRLKAAANAQNRREGKPPIESSVRKMPGTKFKAMGGRIYKAEGGEVKVPENIKKRFKERKPKKPLKGQMKKPKPGTYDYQLQETMRPDYRRPKKAGGGLMEATQRLRRQGLKRGGGVCLRGMNREAVGKNS